MHLTTAERPCHSVIALSQDADKSRAVEETVAAKELQQELAAKWGPTLDAVQVLVQRQEGEGQ